VVDPDLNRLREQVRAGRSQGHTVSGATYGETGSSQARPPPQTVPPQLTPRPAWSQRTGILWIIGLVIVVAFALSLDHRQRPAPGSSMPAQTSSPAPTQGTTATRPGTPFSAIPSNSQKSNAEDRQSLGSLPQPRQLPDPKYTPPTSLDLAPKKPEPSAAFQNGLADRGAWEQWFSRLTGDYRNGAEYWTRQRSLSRPDACYGAGRNQDFVSGCTAAKLRLDPTDVRRKAEPDYRVGWNNYSEPTTGPPTGSGTLPPPVDTTGTSSPQVRWYPNLDAPGNDLGGRAGWVRNLANADDCMRMCLADRACVGVTYNIRYSVCIPKSRIAPLVRAEDPATTGIITDRAEPVLPSGATARVRQYPNMDASGNDRGEWISGVSSKECESICVADSGCAGYTYNRQRLTCTPKNFIGGLAPSSEPAVTGIVEGRNVSGR
jgi:hypothetical protein